MNAARGTGRGTRAAAAGRRPRAGTRRTSRSQVRGAMRTYRTTATGTGHLRVSRLTRTRWRFLLPKVCAWVLLLGAAGLLAYMFINADFYIWDVEVEGARWVQGQDLLQAAGLEGLSIFYADPAAIARRLEALPQIAHAEATCDLPAGVRVLVTERAPAAIWQNHGVQYWVDREGVLFPRLGELENPLIIVEQDGPTRAAGDRVEARVVEAAGRLAELIPGVRIVGYSSTDGLFFDIPQGYRVLTRPERDMKAVAAALQALLDKLAREGSAARVLDLRYESRAYWR
ncbi:MAG: cell division protein FtsQ/DivIB [Anaerolineae bacterium]